MHTNLFRAEFMGGVHEVSADHGEDDGEAMLGRKLHALLELVLKQVGVETETHNTVGVEIETHSTDWCRN